MQIPLPDDFLMTQAEEHMQRFCERNGLSEAVEIKTQWGSPKGRLSHGRKREILT